MPLLSLALPSTGADLFLLRWWSCDWRLASCCSLLKIVSLCFPGLLPFPPPPSFADTSIHGGASNERQHSRCVHTSVQSAATFHDAEKVCKAHGAHICYMGDMQAACGKVASIMDGMNDAWFGDHSGNDDSYMSSNSNTCAERSGSNMDGTAKPSTDSRKFKCCLN